MDTYKQLPVWQQTMAVAVQVYHSARQGVRPRWPELDRMLCQVAIRPATALAEASMASAATFLVGLRQALRSLKRLEVLITLADQLACWNPAERNVLQQTVAECRVQLEAFQRTLGMVEPNDAICRASLQNELLISARRFPRG